MFSNLSLTLGENQLKYDTVSCAKHQNNFLYKEQLKNTLAVC